MIETQQKILPQELIEACEVPVGSVQQEDLMPHIPRTPFERQLLLKELRLELFEQYGIIPGYRVV